MGPGSAVHVRNGDGAAPTTDTPNKTPVASSANFSRLHRAEETLPYGNMLIGAKPCVWPPKINVQHNFNLANYPPMSAPSPHLQRLNIVAGLGGIDPTM